MRAAASPPRVAVLMATRDGAAYLDEQLESLHAQTHPLIDLWISDDGSADATRDVIQRWRGRWSKGCVRLRDGPQRGFAENFRSLIVDRAIGGDYFAYCDQDDVWEPDKLERAIAALEGEDASLPLLFCSRTRTMSEEGELLGGSPPFLRPPSFRNALVQSLAGGNTMVFNAVARERLAAASARTPFVSHDWWTYLIVTGCGGRVHFSQEPFVRYRQHARNQVGANTSWRARSARLRRLFEGQFADWLDLNLEGLSLNRDMLCPDAREALETFSEALRGPAWSRLRALRRSGVYRQTPLGSLTLMCAVGLGWV